MDIDNLRAFVSITKTGSFSVASEKLYVTQPAISKRIATLEQELNTRLFDRIGRKIRLTEAGHIFLPHAQQVLQAVENARRSLSHLSDTVQGPLNIATSHHTGLHRLPKVLTHYTQTYPQVDLAIEFMDSEVACKAVAQGELELAVVTLPLNPIENINAQQIWHDPLVFVVRKGHALSKKPVQLRELVRHPAILPDTSTYTRELIENLFSRHKLELNVHMSTNYLESIKMLVNVGLGWSVLPTSMLDKSLQVLKVPNVRINRQLGVVWHARHSLSSPAKAFLDYLLEIAEKT